MSSKWRSALLDILVAIALAVTFFAPSVRDTARGVPAGPEAEPVVTILLVATGLVFVLRRPFPALYVGLTLLLVLTYTGLGHEPGPIFLAPPIALAVCFTNVAQRYWVPILLGCGAGYIVAVHWQQPTLVSVLYTAALWFGTGGALALGISLYRENIVTITRRAEYAERTREQEAERKVANERIRIARELHDAVGHRLATISLQAGVAAHLASPEVDQSSDPDPTHEALTAIRKESTEALRELRSTLGILREQDATGDDLIPTTPTPQLGDLATLVETMRTAGVDLRAELNLDAVEVPEMVAAACYRVVQESLTNAARHAPTSTVTLRISALPKGIEIVVRNPTTAHDTSRSGLGLLGMRERVSAFGGVFDAGPDGAGTFRVWAVLPFAPASSPAVGAR